MSFGIQVFDENEVETLGMDDFTLQRLAIMKLQGFHSSGNGTRSDYITMDVAGYDPAKCFVLITPQRYAPYPQGASQSYWGCIPTYVDLGGTRIGIITYSNLKNWNASASRFSYSWISQMVESTIEVVRFV